MSDLSHDLEAAFWQQPDDDERLERYQQACREAEARNGGEGTRHHFIIVIPVADRPQHLEACLESTLKLCDDYGYGGRRDGCYEKVQVVVADDSRDTVNIARHRQLATDYTRRGLRCEHFGQEEQLAQLARIGADQRSQLTTILGDTPADAFYHKGASIQRNIAYLRLTELATQQPHTLIYFIDSDQEFQVSLQTISGERNRYAINYLQQLDRLFRERDVVILTGKVVGDPPVSPAVMAGNFLEDVTAFLQTLLPLGADTACSFHGERQNSDDAAYHDMADLFGFKRQAEAFHYHCELQGPHDHAACLAAFADKLNRFFDGEHPTRKSFYEHRPIDETVVPARTIYTGNYCFRPEALRYFIPFAKLKLRMAGPVLGRIIKAELGGRFVSANLPMLHKRTVEAIGQSEFRPGIDRAAHQVDLSGEFERQFFGDVMLFSMERLTDTGYPQSVPPLHEIETIVTEVTTQMQQNYTAKHRQIGEKISVLQTLLQQRDAWWRDAPHLAAARDQLALFVNNMEHNFGDGAQGYQLIHSEQHLEQRQQAIIEALLHYQNERDMWQEVLA